jgi:hypothetical protein
MTGLCEEHQEASRSHHCDHPDLADGLSLDPINELAASETGGAWGRPEHRPPHRTGPVGCCTGRGGEVVAGRTSASRLAHAAEAPDVTGCRGISYSRHFPRQPAVVRVPPPPIGRGATARHHRASPQGAELTARDITFSWLGRRGASS